LTIVLPRSPEIPNIVTAGGDTVGIRWPNHPFIQAVIRRCDFPIAAPSANVSNQVSPTNAKHVVKSLGGRIPLIVDGGQSQVGIESTVLDLTVSPPRLLRPGMINAETILAVTGKIAVAEDGRPQALRSPGQLPRHYSPKARLVILSWRDDEDLKLQSSRFNIKMKALHIISHTRIPSSEGFGRVSVIPHDAEAFARALYAELHQCDDAEAQLIIVEALPESSEWRAIRDRLTRASAS
jgi:L-threonylcarbamoyladenylate synthase